MRIAILIIAVVISSSCFAKNPVILLSIDGFAYDYLATYKPKNILALAKNGATTDGMLPVFPSKTFPNHISIATGQYPVTHGIVHNKFYHRKLKKYYALGAGKNNSDWLTATPIWTLAEQHQLKTAIYFWPESEATVDGILPTYYFPYHHNTPNKKRINQIVDWLKMPLNERPDFIAGYFSTVDSAGHDYGVNSKEVAIAINEIDKSIGELIQRITAETDVTPNIILVSDHGMLNIDANNSINVEELFSSFNDIDVVNGQTQLYIYEESKKRLNDVRSHLIHSEYANRFNVYMKNNFPSHWQFDVGSDVVPDMIIDVKAPNTFTHDKSRVKKATHGFDPYYTPEMKAIFIATGPNINPGKVLPFQNIHVFSLIEKLLGLPESPNVASQPSILANIVKNKAN